MYSGYKQALGDDRAEKAATAAGNDNSFASKQARLDDESNFVHAEVVRRKHVVTQKDLEEEAKYYVSNDINEVLEMKPKKKFQWLEKALDGIKNGTQKMNPIFEIFKHKEYVNDLSNADGRRALYMIKGVMEFMSWRQQKFVLQDHHLE